MADEQPPMRQASEEEFLDELIEKCERLEHLLSRELRERTNETPDNES